MKDRILCSLMGSGAVVVKILRTIESFEERIKQGTNFRGQKPWAISPRGVRARGEVVVRRGLAPPTVLEILVKYLNSEINFLYATYINF